MAQDMSCLEPHYRWFTVYGCSWSLTLSKCLVVVGPAFIPVFRVVWWWWWRCTVSVAAALSWHFAILVNKLGKILKIFEQLDHL